MNSDVSENITILNDNTNENADSTRQDATQNQHPPHYQNKEHKGGYVPKTIKKNTNFKRQKSTEPQQPNTIYNAIKQFKVEGFFRKDIRKISNIVRTKFTEKFGEIEPEKIEQDEKDKIFQVYCYPESMRKEIYNIVSWYFKVKNERAEKHIRQLSREKLEKLKKEGSPDYEMALVKYNIAEEERRKKEKISQAEQFKKEKLKSKYEKAGGQKNFQNRRGPNQGPNRNQGFNKNQNFGERKFVKRTPQGEGGEYNPNRGEHRDRNYTPNRDRNYNQNRGEHRDRNYVPREYNPNREYNKDRQFNPNKEYNSNREYNKDRQFNPNPTSTPLPSTPPPVVDNVNVVNNNVANNNVVEPKPKTGLVDKFLSKFKSSSSD